MKFQILDTYNTRVNKTATMVEGELDIVEGLWEKTSLFSYPSLASKFLEGHLILDLVLV